MLLLLLLLNPKKTPGNNIFPFVLRQILENLWLSAVHLLLSIRLFFCHPHPHPVPQAHGQRPHRLSSLTNYLPFWKKGVICGKPRNLGVYREKEMRWSRQGLSLTQTLKNISDRLWGSLEMNGESSVLLWGWGEKILWIMRMLKRRYWHQFSRGRKPSIRREVRKVRRGEWNTKRKEGWKLWQPDTIPETAWVGDITDGFGTNPIIEQLS